MKKPALEFKTPAAEPIRDPYKPLVGDQSPLPHDFIEKGGDPSLIFGRGMLSAPAEIGQEAMNLVNKGEAPSFQAALRVKSPSGLVARIFKKIFHPEAEILRDKEKVEAELAAVNQRLKEVRLGALKLINQRAGLRAEHEKCRIALADLKTKKGQITRSLAKHVDVVNRQLSRTKNMTMWGLADASSSAAACELAQREIDRMITVATAAEEKARRVLAEFEAKHASDFELVES